MLVSQQQQDGHKPHHCQGTEAEYPNQRKQQKQHRKMKQARNPQCISDAAKTKIAQNIKANFLTKVWVSVPAGSARTFVRGLAASMETSANRLKDIAADRAATIATTIQIIWCVVGTPRAASMAPHNANGSAKMECSHLIISSVTRRFFSRGTLHCKRN